jgi:hypothetical protein
MKKRIISIAMATKVILLLMFFIINTFFYDLKSYSIILLSSLSSPILYNNPTGFLTYNLNPKKYDLPTLNLTIIKTLLLK